MLVVVRQCRELLQRVPGVLNYVDAFLRKTVVPDEAKSGNA